MNFTWCEDSQSGGNSIGVVTGLSSRAGRGGEKRGMIPPSIYLSLGGKIIPGDDRKRDQPKVYMRTIMCDGSNPGVSLYRCGAYAEIGGL